MGYDHDIRAVSDEEYAWVLTQVKSERQELVNPQIFEDELTRLEIIIDRHKASMLHTQAIYDRVETLKNISFGLIQHNNPSWRDLVSEFKNGEINGGSTPSWAGTADPKFDGEPERIRRGEDSLPGDYDGRRND